jgi:hypothetical protein
MKFREKVRHEAVALMLALVAVLPVSVAAQSPWSVAFELGGVRYSGTTKSGDDDLHLLPASHTEGGVGVIRRFGDFTLAAMASYGSTGLAADGPEAELVQKGTASLYEFRAIGMQRLWTLHENVQIAAGGGPALQVWNLVGELSRYRLALQARLGASVPLSRILTLQLNGELSVTPSSPLEQFELPDGFESMAMWRRSLFLGLRLRL